MKIDRKHQHLPLTREALKRVDTWTRTKRRPWVRVPVPARRA